MAVIVAPSGTKGRTQSNRRFIVCRETNDHERVVIFKRTDNFDTAVKEVRRLASRGTYDTFVWDRVTASLVPTDEVRSGVRRMFRGTPTRFGRVMT